MLRLVEKLTARRRRARRIPGPNSTSVREHGVGGIAAKLGKRICRVGRRWADDEPVECARQTAVGVGGRRIIERIALRPAVGAVRRLAPRAELGAGGLVFVARDLVAEDPEPVAAGAQPRDGARENGDVAAALKRAEQKIMTHFTLLL